MKINAARALALLERATKDARAGQVDQTWAKRVSELRNVAFPSSITYSIAFGAAALAKSTDPKVDALSVKARAGGRAYSMRGIGNGVLAANALRLGIDLGLRKREPLNNQPFFSINSVEDIEDRSDNHAVRSKLIELLKVLDRETAAGAFNALTAYIASCPVPVAAPKMAHRAGDDLDQRGLVHAIERFVSEDSERGARAQAVAAGLVDVKFGTERVRVEGVYSPSRNHPLDVAVLTEADGDEFELAYEVRDKPVVAAEIGFVAQAAQQWGIRYAGLLAISRAQRPFDPNALAEQQAVAVRFGVFVRVFTGWTEFVADALWYPVKPATPGDAYRAIYGRLADLDVSPEGVASWRGLSKLS